MCKFNQELLQAHEFNAVAGWFGSVGLSFKAGEDCDKYRRYYTALRSVSGIENITNPDKETPNKYGVICVTYEPKTATAAAIGKLITEAFTND